MSDIKRYSILPDFRFNEQIIRPITRNWNFRLNYAVRFSRYLNQPLNITQNLFGGLTFYATKNWKIDYSATYDFETKKMISQHIVIYRDMNCWEGRIVWHPTGYRKDFYVKINIKELPEVKIEQSLQY